MFTNHVMVSEDTLKLCIHNINELKGNMGSTFLLDALEDSL